MAQFLTLCLTKRGVWCNIGTKETACETPCRMMTFSCSLPHLMINEPVGFTRSSMKSEDEEAIVENQVLGKYDA
jgi:hypothetical protein